MKVTLKYIMKHRRKGGAWSAKQLNAIGVGWPPKKGWKQRSIGYEMTPKQQIAFETGQKVKKGVKVFEVTKLKVISPEAKMRTFMAENPNDPAITKARELSSNGKMSLFAALALYIDVREL